MIRDGTKTTTIIDNFKEQPGYPNSYTLSAAPTTLGEGDEPTQITFTATLGRQECLSPSPSTSSFSCSDSGSKGTAALTDDYTLSRHPRAIPGHHHPGQRSPGPPGP